MELFGTLDDFFETGSEGIWWAIQRPPFGPEKGSSPAWLEFLKEGDYLEIYSPNDLYTNLTRTVLWSGHIKKDRTSCITQSKFNPEHRQQSVCGRWVHWLQDGFSDHEQWFWYFAMGYPAKLVRK